MHSRNEELPLAVEIRNTEGQLHVYDGLMAAMRDPRAMLDVLLEAEDIDAARSELRTRLGIDELQANAVLDLQFRRATKLERGKIEERRDEIVAHLEFLRGLRSAGET
jgi:DNA gyrase/topoisomerase IV subunit A